MNGNILVDRHHAGLYHSLQLLLEDRLGYKVWTPVGMEWWSNYIWRFGDSVWHDDRLAQQFLVASPAWRRQGLVLEQRDDEFPDRAIWGVTYEDACRMEWAAVVASVPDNQRGMAQFARAVGAKFVVQVGNTGQHIDWSLDPLVVNNSEMPMLGRHVNVGQEFDSDGLLGYTPPLNISPSSNIVASFVNCMPSIACWPLLDAARSDERFDVQVHGIDGPDGNLKPLGKIADCMKVSHWGWHDKAHGDGFGHVIHYWASIGRPLVGHASHYAGKTAAPLWRDLETCIDLDRHPLDEALDIMASMPPQRHREMCRAIREVFDSVTDWERDAELVRGLLA